MTGYQTSCRHLSRPVDIRAYGGWELWAEAQGTFRNKYYPLRDALLRPERSASGFLRHLRSSEGDGYSRNEELFNFSTTPPTCRMLRLGLY